MPNAMPVSAPVVLKRRHSSASSSGGKFALGGEHERHAHEHGDVEAGADRQRAEDRGRRRRRPRRSARPCARPPRCRGRARSSTGRGRSRRPTRSRARRRPRGSSRTRPRRTARARCRRRRCPRRRRGTAPAAARRGCRPCRRPRSRPGRAAPRAPKPMIVTIAVNVAMMPIVQSTDLRAALESGTVKKRVRMCGRPAVPMKIVRPVEITRIGDVRYVPGPRIALPSRVVRRPPCRAACAG